MYKSDYERKVANLMEKGIENGTYKRLLNTENSFHEDRQKILNLIDTQTDTSTDTKNTLHKAISSNLIMTPKLYIVIKLHKLGLPGRPIVSATNSPTRSLQKFLLPLLQRLVNNRMNVKNSKYIKSEISHIHVPDSHHAVTFDIKDMFTNISIELALIIIKSNFHKVKPFTDSLQNLHTINILCTHSCKHILLL